jgi:Glycosyl transferase family 2
VVSGHARVTVCIPTMERPALLREAIASVAAQTFADFEVLVVDNSGDIEQQRRIDAVLAEFPQVRLILRRNPERLQVIDNFNSLIDHARGELWAVLPDDDRWRPEFLARSVAALDRYPECGFSFADHWILSGSAVDQAVTAANSATFGRTALREGVYPHAALFPLALAQSFCLQTALFRHRLMADLRFVPGILVVDHSLFLRIAALAEPVAAYYIDARIMEYRVHPGQITTTTRRKELLEAEVGSFRSVSQVPPQHEKAYRAKLAGCHLALALLDAEAGDHGGARQHARESLRLSFNLRTALGAALASVAPFAVGPIRRIRGRRLTPGAREPDREPLASRGARRVG